MCALLRANRLGHLLGAPPLGTVQQESCVTHNTLRLSSELFRATRRVRYADFMERLQLNGVLGTQRGDRPVRVASGLEPRSLSRWAREARLNRGCLWTWRM